MDSHVGGVIYGKGVQTFCTHSDIERLKAGTLEPWITGGTKVGGGASEYSPYRDWFFVCGQAYTNLFDSVH